MVDEVNDLVPRTAYTASASQVDFDFPWPILNADHLVVLVDGVEVTTYTVAGVGEDEGGTITMDDPMVGGEEVVLYRATALERLSDIPTNNGMSSRTVNNELDKLYLILQDLRLGASRALSRLLSDTDDDAPSFDAQGGQLKNLADGTDAQDAATVAQLAGIATGDIPPGGILLTAIEDIPDQRVLLNVSGGAAAPIAGTPAQLRTMLGQSANGTSLVTAANYAAMRALLDLEAGTDFYSTGATDSAIAAAVAGLYDIKASQDCSSNPNYPAASKGDVYFVSVAGKIGGGSGTTVEVGDSFVAIADNAGGTQGSVGASWVVVQGNVAFTSAGLAVATAASAAAQRVVLGLDQDLIEFIIDGGGSTITTGIKGDIGPLPFACTVTAASALADQSGSIAVDIWKDTYANFPPDNADSITASAPVTITTATKSQDSTLTGWTVALAAGDILRYNVDSCTSIQRCAVSLKVTR